MTKFDRESFNLLKMTDSGSESVPDLTFDLPNDNRQKKKVRLKRKERKTRGGGGGGNPQMGKLQESWWCCCLSLPYLPSSSCFMALSGALAVIAVISIGFFTSNLHYKIQVLETQLKAKIVDDDAKSVPEALEMIKKRLSVLESNQSSVALQLGKINTAISKLETRLDLVNLSLSTAEEDPAKLRQNVAELRLGVGEVTKRLELMVNRSLGNSDSITTLDKELKELKLESNIENNGVTTVPTPISTLSLLGTQLDLLNSSVKLHSRRLDAINSTVLSIEHNSTIRLDMEHNDVVAINGKVSQLQDDNLYVSSSLASLSDRCFSQLQTLLVNITSLQTKVTEMEARQEQLQHREEQKKMAAELLPASVHLSLSQTTPSVIVPEVEKENNVDSREVPTSVEDGES